MALRITKELKFLLENQLILHGVCMFELDVLAARTRIKVDRTLGCHTVITTYKPSLHLCVCSVRSGLYYKTKQ